MTMQFLSDVKAEINANITTNGNGDISGADVRNILQNMVDSLYYRSAALIGDHSAAPLAQPLTTTPTNYPNLYTNELEIDPAVVAADLVAGTVSPLLGGFICEAVMGFVASGANGRIVTAQLFKNGVAQSRFRLQATMTGAGEPDAAHLALPLIGVLANDVFDMRLSVDTNATITFTSLSLVLRVIPTFAPV